MVPAGPIRWRKYHWTRHPDALFRHAFHSVEEFARNQQQADWKASPPENRLLQTKSSPALSAHDGPNQEFEVVGIYEWTPDGCTASGAMWFQTKLRPL